LTWILFTRVAFHLANIACTFRLSLRRFPTSSPGCRVILCLPSGSTTWLQFDLFLRTLFTTFPTLGLLRPVILISPDMVLVTHFRCSELKGVLFPEDFDASNVLSFFLSHDAVHLFSTVFKTQPIRFEFFFPTPRCRCMVGILPPRITADRQTEFASFSRPSSLVSLSFRRKVLRHIEPFDAGDFFFVKTPNLTCRKRSLAFSIQNSSVFPSFSDFIWIRSCLSMQANFLFRFSRFRDPLDSLK